MSKEGDIKLAVGEIRGNGYWISLYYDEEGGNVNWAAGFGAFTKALRLSDKPAKPANGIVAQFSPVSCGGSCGPANLYWKQNGVMYKIQIRFSSDTKEIKQEQILIQTANSMVRVRK